MSSTTTTFDYDVLIIGGGPAGIAAAIDLRKQGRTVMILEARQRLGGRVFTDYIDGGNTTSSLSPIDLGASWIHHYGPSNPLTHLAQSQPLSKPCFLGTPESVVCDTYVRSDADANSASSSPITQSDYELASRVYGEIEELREQAAEKHIEQYHQHDCGAGSIHEVEYRDYIKRSLREKEIDPLAASEETMRRRKETAKLSSPSTTHDINFSSFLSTPTITQLINTSLTTLGSREIFNSFLNDIESYEGASLKQLSAYHAGEECQNVSDVNMSVVSGYGELIQSIARQNQVPHKFGCVVTAVDYDMEGVSVNYQNVDTNEEGWKTQHGSRKNPNEAPNERNTQTPGATSSSSSSSSTLHTLRSRYCILTVPLGVLKRNLITFTPALPAWKQHAIKTLGFGLLNKVVLQWDRRWWPEQDMSALTLVTDGSDNKDVPLWFVNFSKPLEEMNRTVKEMKDESSTAVASSSSSTSSSLCSSSPAWQRYHEHSRPLQPFIQEGDELVSELMSEEEAEKIKSKHTDIIAAISTSSSASSSSATTIDGPHILVCFIHNFDDEDDTSAASSSSSTSSYPSSSHESQPDSVILEKIMSRLRQAFCSAAGAAAAAGENDKSKELSITTRKTPSNVRTKCDVDVQSVDGTTSTITFPYSYNFPRPVITASSHSPLSTIPSPSSYIITRWGKEPFSYGAYTHYKKGSGAHDVCVMAEPVRVWRKGDGRLSVEEEVEEKAAASSTSTPPSCRILFAGEATQAVHLGCADSAWLSGQREARRIAALWSVQEKQLA